MAMRSSPLMTELRAQVSLDFSFRRAGKLVVLSKPSELEAAGDTCTVKRQYGCDVRVITAEQAIEIEPALAFIKTPFAGAVYSENDEVGDVLSFTSQLGQWLGNNGSTEFQFNTTVHRIITKAGNLSAIETSNVELRPDAVVGCLGAWSDRILKSLGIRATIYRAGGYIVNLPACAESN